MMTHFWLSYPFKLYKWVSYERTLTHQSCFELLTSSQMWQEQKETRDRNRVCVCLYNLTLPNIKQPNILYPVTVTHYEDQILQPLLKEQFTKKNYIYSPLSCYKPVFSSNQESMKWSEVETRFECLNKIIIEKLLSKSFRIYLLYYTLR